MVRCTLNKQSDNISGRNHIGLKLVFMCELELNDFGNSAHEWESVGIETETHCWEASDLTDYAIHVTKQLLQVVQKYKSMKCDCESKSPVTNNSHNYIIKLKKKKANEGCEQLFISRNAFS